MVTVTELLIELIIATPRKLNTADISKADFNFIHLVTVTVEIAFGASVKPFTKTTASVKIIDVRVNGDNFNISIIVSSPEICKIAFLYDIFIKLKYINVKIQLTYKNLCGKLNTKKIYGGLFSWNISKLLKLAICAKVLKTVVVANARHLASLLAKQAVVLLTRNAKALRKANN